MGGQRTDRRRRNPGRAGVSSRAFYQSFTDIRDCFLAAYEDSVHVVLQAAVNTADAPGERPPLRQFASMLDAYLHLIASHPNMARTFLVEVYAAGDAALRRRLEVHDQFVDGVGRILMPSGPLDGSQRLAIESLVDAVTFRVTRLVIAGPLDHPDQVRDQLLDLARRLFPELAS